MARKPDRSPALKLDCFLPYRLSVASNAVSSRIAKSYRKRFNLKITEWRLIAILAEYDSMTPQVLAKSAQIDKINVSRAAKALIARKLVVVTPNGKDRRSHLLSLSKAGRELYDEIVPEALALEARLFSGFSELEISALESLLRRIELAAEA